MALQKSQNSLEAFNNIPVWGKLIIPLALAALISGANAHFVITDINKKIKAAEGNIDKNKKRNH